MKMLFFFPVLMCMVPLLPSDNDEIIELSDPRPVYTVGVTTVYPDDDGSFAYFSARLVEMIKSEVSRIPTHRYTETEIADYKTLIKKLTIDSLQSELSAQYSKRDSAFLEGNEKNRVSARDSIDTLRIRLERITADMDVSYTVSEEKPIVYKELPPVKGSVPDSAFLMQNDLDCLVAIELSNPSGLTGVLMTFVDNRGDEDRFFRKIGTIEEVFESLREELSTIRTRLRGFEAAFIEIRTDPEDAAIYIDDIHSGTGLYTAELVPGEYSIQVMLNGYTSASDTLIIDKTQDVSLSYTLDSLVSLTYAIQSVPSDVHVYVDSKPVGVTPLFFHTYDPDHVIQFSLDGYRDKTLLLGEDSQSAIMVSLRKDYEFDEKLGEKCKWNFKRSFGAFLLSIPVTLFLSSYRTSFEVRGSTMENEYTATTIGMYGSMYLNAVLFVQTVISLREYVNTVKYSVRGDYVGVFR